MGEKVTSIDVTWQISISNDHEAHALVLNGRKPIKDPVGEHFVGYETISDATVPPSGTNWAQRRAIVKCFSNTFGFISGQHSSFPKVV